MLMLLFKCNTNSINLPATISAQIKYKCTNSNGPQAPAQAKQPCPIAIDTLSSPRGVGRMWAKLRQPSDLALCESRSQYIVCVCSHMLTNSLASARATQDPVSINVRCAL